MQLNSEGIKKYLKDVLELEKNKYETMRMIKEIENNRFQYYHKSRKDEPLDMSTGCIGIIGFTVIGTILGLVIGIILVATSDDGKITPLLPSIIVCTILGVVLAIIYICYMRYSDKKEDNEIEIENKNNVNLVNKQNSILSESEEKLKIIQQDTELALKKVYSIDIIYPKYRNFVAMSSIYEYFDSGRCTTLAEAYNLYETEVRMNRIIEKLDIIISKLDEIKQNQYYMYNAIKSLQPKIERLTSSVKNCAEHLDRIEANTAVTAYTTEIIEKNQFYMRNFTNSFHM